MAAPPLREHVAPIPDAQLRDAERPIVPRSYSHDLSSTSSMVDDSDNSSLYTDEEVDASDSEDDMSTSEPASSPEPAPELPSKSSMRVNKLLGTLPHKINAVEQPILSQATPHELYLSSEEDASSSADDSEGCFDSDDDLSIISGDLDFEPCTARAVPVVFFGKPSIIDLSRRETESSHQLRSEPSSSQPSFAKRMSIVSVASSVVSVSPSRPRSTVTVDFMEKPRPFLESDPYPSSTTYSASTSDLAKPQLIRQESMLRKTLQLVQKRSRPRLHHTGSSRDSLLVAKASLSRPETPVSITEESDNVYQPARRHFTFSNPPAASMDVSSPPPLPNRRRGLSSFSVARGVRA